MNIFDHDALFEQIGFTNPVTNSKPATSHQSLQNNDRDQVMGPHLSQPTFADNRNSTSNNMNNNFQDSAVSQEMMRPSQSDNNINMTLGELLSKKSARNSSLDNSTNNAVLIENSGHPEGTPQIYANRRTVAVDPNQDSNQEVQRQQTFQGHFGGNVPCQQNSTQQHSRQPSESIQQIKMMQENGQWPNHLTQIKNNHNQHNDTYSSNELLGSLANARPLPPPSEQVSTSLLAPTSTSGFLTKRELMKVTIDLGENQQETILVREGESAEMVSRAFAAKFDLTEDTEFLLREQIEYNLAQLPNQTQSNISSATLTKSQVTQKLPSVASGLPTLTKNRTNMEFSAPISEVGLEQEEAEIDDQDCEQHSISNINSMDPAQWSNVKRDIVDQNIRQDAIRKRLMYPFIASKTDQKTTKSKKKSPARRSHSREDKKHGSTASILNKSHDEMAALRNAMGQVPPDNYGQVLYLKGKVQALGLEKKRRQLQEQRDINEMKDATFKPEIGSSGQRITRDKTIKTEDFLLFQGRLANEKKKKLKMDIERQEMKDVSFKPVILKKSEEIVKRKNGLQVNHSENVSDGQRPSTSDPSQRSQELYQEAFIRKERLERMQREAEKECSFQPKLMTKKNNYHGVNKSFSSTPGKYMVLGVNGPIKEVDESMDLNLNSNVFDRLNGDAKALPEKRRGREIQRLKNELVDEKTGQEFYRPKTGKSFEGRASEVKNEGGISNYLFKKHKLKEEAQKQQKKQHDKSYKKEIEMEKKQSQNRISELLLQQKIQLQLEQLFLAFDSNGNGFISSDEINLDNVSAQILEIFSPLFVEMESLDEQLSKEDFQDSAFNLYQTLGPIDKSAILNFKKDATSLEQKHENKDQTFQPRLDPNSEQIVQSSELQGVSVVDRLYWAEIQRQENLSRMQQEQMKADMKECSFAPKIDPNSEELAHNAIQRQALLNQFSAIEMGGNDLHDISELQQQQSPNFHQSHNFRPEASSQQLPQTAYDGHLMPDFALTNYAGQQLISYDQQAQNIQAAGRHQQYLQPMMVNLLTSTTPPGAAGMMSTTSGFTPPAQSQQQYLYQQQMAANQSAYVNGQQHMISQALQPGLMQIRL